MASVRPLFKCHGGKHYLANWIIAHMPKHSYYVEPFVGGGSVFFNKRGNIRSHLNDISPGVISIYHATLFKLFNFQRNLSSLTYSKETFEKSLERKWKSEVDHYVIRRMSRGGLMKSFAWSDRLRGGLPGDVNAWNTAIKLLGTHNTILTKTSCMLTCCHAIDVINEYDTKGKECLIYCDPPYLQATRTAKRAYGEFEMSNEDHTKLLETLVKSRCNIILSGYTNPLYEHYLQGWRKYAVLIANHSGQGLEKQIRTECLWTNY